MAYGRYIYIGGSQTLIRWITMASIAVHLLVSQGDQHWILTAWPSAAGKNGGFYCLNG